MSNTTVLILGGYGNTGRSLAEYLLQETEVQVVIASRRLEKAREMADYLNTKFDGYVFTAVPVVATLLQLLDDSARKPGLHLQAHLFEPQRLMRDMVRLGIEITPQPAIIDPATTDLEAKYV